MSPKLARRVRSAAPIVVLFVVIAVTWDVVTFYLNPVEPLKPLLAAFIGVLIALPLILLESSRVAERFRRFPFWATVLLKTVTYAGALSAIFLGAGLIVGLMEGKTMEQFYDSVPQNLLSMSVSFAVYGLIIFFRQLDRLLGPGVLIRYMLGRYHRPRREQRIFMFVDITGSTALSERLSLEAYYGLINDFFHDVSAPVLDTRGEIYEYVGDEVVITWKRDRGIENANCVRAFFQIDAAVRANSERYLKLYGAVPDFKAGLHFGEVITAEMGDLKKEIAFNGEVLNVTARIQGECNRLGRRLLASRALFEDLEFPSDLTAETLGPIALRGIEAPTEIVAFA
jgi:adenylate cyclase